MADEATAGGGKRDRRDPERDEDRAHEDETQPTEPDPEDAFQEIVQGARETLRETINRKYGSENHGLATLGFAAARYLDSKSRTLSFVAELYDEGAPRVKSSFELDDLEIGFVQAGLQVLTLVMDPTNKIQDDVKALLKKISDATQASAKAMSEEEKASANAASRRVRERQMVEQLRELGRSLGLDDEEIETTIANAQAKAQSIQMADDEVGFKSGPLQ